MRTGQLLTAAAALGGLAVVLLPASPAAAHPLGNFSVNEYVGLTVRPDRVDAAIVVDIAEIPTLQDRSTVDEDHDGSVNADERVRFAKATCADVANTITLRAGPNRLQWTVSAASFEYAAGAGGLDVSRLTCELTAPATLDGRIELAVVNGYLAERVGWREMTAVGDGMRLVDSPLPSASVSRQLRDYPKDLLSSALDVRTAVITAEPGAGTGGPAAARLTAGGDPVSRWMAALDRRFADLAGGPHLTIWVGLLAVALAVLLGAGHAALPGHGKTVLAAYLAGRRGRPRDALLVAGTVTLTHTGGVLLLGLLLTAGTALAGERILGWLGLVSGVIVLGVGVAMVLGLRRRARGHDGSGHEHDGHDRDGHAPGHPHGDHDGHEGHDHGGHGEAGHGPGHPHGGHDHDRHQGHDHGHPHGRGHRHGHDHVHSGHIGRSTGRGLTGLAGIGVAGGLVPSPSALVVLLGAIGLGRTGFGVLLVLAYGVGMAGTLTGAGLLLVLLQRRLTRAGVAGRAGRRLARFAGRLHTATPAVTAALVVIVGAGLAARAAAGVL